MRGMAPRSTSGYDIFHDKANEVTYKRVLPGQFVIHLRSFQGGFAHSAIEGICSPAYTVFGFTNKNTDNDIFWKYIFASERFIQSLVSVTYGIRDGRSISYEEFLKMSFRTPKKDEQTKIATFLLSLDSAITLHQRKCDALIKVKKSMLQKMFPKNGKSKPEVRFAGFTDDWEQRKLGEIYENITEKNDLTYGIDKNITVATMQFKDDIRVTDQDYLKTYNVFQIGDIAFEGHQSKEFRYGRFVENDIGNGIVSHIFAVFRPKIDYDLYYWKYAINNENLMKAILSRCTKASTMMNDLVTKDFLEEKYFVPSIAEQQRIGTFFRKLDSAITLHQREVEKLTKLKKALLSKMFI